MTQYVQVNPNIYETITFDGGNSADIAAWLNGEYQAFIGTSGKLFLIQDHFSGVRTYVYNVGETLLKIVGNINGSDVPQGLQQITGDYLLVEKDEAFPPQPQEITPNQ